VADHIVCRCEDVTREDITAAIVAGATNAQEIKMRTRAGMGPCQGRVCRPALEQMVGVADDTLLTASSALTVHLPVRPVALGQLATPRDPS
jgi:NAD(P)H-nitrite reductase large subunit